MKAAAVIIAVLAWGGLLAAMWYPLLADTRPPLSPWLGVVAVSLFVGLVVPSFLLGMETRAAAVAGLAKGQPHWTIKGEPSRPTTRGERPATPKRDE